MAAIAQNCQLDWEGAAVAEIIERVAALEAHVSNIRDAQDRQEIATDHLSAKVDCHHTQTIDALNEIKIKIAERNSASKERSRNIAVAGAALGTAATAIGGFVWLNLKAVIAFFAAVFR